MWLNGDVFHHSKFCPISVEYNRPDLEKCLPMKPKLAGGAPMKDEMDEHQALSN
jgi:hypothetical protein